MEDLFGPEGKLLWDGWYFKKDDEFHVFFLQTEPVDDHHKRHDEQISIGHAVSEDLINWKELETALEPGDAGSWDSMGLWTGCVIDKDNLHYMFYTGRNEDTPWKQEIGLATSKDLNTWVKYPGNPILRTDTTYYELEKEKNSLDNVGAWRDPFVFWDVKREKYYMIFAARKKGASRDYNGCVGIAESDDLETWKVLPPILDPGLYDEMEVPQMIRHERAYFLFFSTHAKNCHPSIPSGQYGGLYCYYSKDLFGEYTPVNDSGLVLDYKNALYGLTLVRRHWTDDEYTMLGWLNLDELGNFVGKLSRPITISINNFDVDVKEWKPIRGIIEEDTLLEDEEIK